VLIIYHKNTEKTITCSKNIFNNLPFNNNKQQITNLSSVFGKLQIN